MVNVDPLHLDALLGEKNWVSNLKIPKTEKKTSQSRLQLSGEASIGECWRRAYARRGGDAARMRRCAISVSKRRVKRSGETTEAVAVVNWACSDHVAHVWAPPAPAIALIWRRRGGGSSIMSPPEELPQQGAGRRRLKWRQTSWRSRNLIINQLTRTANSASCSGSSPESRARIWGASRRRSGLGERLEELRRVDLLLRLRFPFDWWVLVLIVIFCYIAAMDFLLVPSPHRRSTGI